MDAQRNGRSLRASRSKWFFPVAFAARFRKPGLRFAKTVCRCPPDGGCGTSPFTGRRHRRAIEPSDGLDRARLDASYRRWLLDKAQHQPGEVRGPHLSIVALVDEPAHLDAVIKSVVVQSFEDWDCRSSR